ncbi:hypothetical protein LPA44_12755 [Halobacterium sp. KA-4]|uniref:hypothetical protein n=1 Tax=Halobacterium sp. KA-4 TaxID=2896367 RepID=UPI001E303F82|nr:hypothetical protein [Halobacterium sp. KA-4]MCD2200761.1 hypothetical protein [Halobacterium sp. KA-4]
MIQNLDWLCSGVLASTASGLAGLADARSAVLLGIAPGLVAVVLWSPFLLSGRLRSLFRRLPPANSLLISYLVVGVGLAVPFVLGTVVALVRMPQAVVSNVILDTVVQIAFVYVVALPLLAGDVLPKLGVDWDSTGYGGTTWLLLVGGVVWYVVIVAVPLGFLAVLLAIPH